MPTLTPAEVANATNQIQTLSRVRETVLAVRDQIGGFLGGVASVVAALAAPPPKDTQGVSFLHFRNADIKMLMRSIAGIEPEPMRNKMAALVRPMVVDSNQDYVCKLFGISPDKYEALGGDDDAVDTSLAEVDRSSHSSHYVRDVYYCRGAIIRRNGRYTLILAYTFHRIELPWYSLTTLVQSDSDVK